MPEESESKERKRSHRSRSREKSKEKTRERSRDRRRDDSRDRYKSRDRDAKSRDREKDDRDFKRSKRSESRGRKSRKRSESRSRSRTRSRSPKSRDRGKSKNEENSKKKPDSSEDLGTTSFPDPRRERWARPSKATSVPAETEISEMVVEKDVKVKPPPPPPRPPPKVLPENTTNQEIDNYYHSLMENWNDELKALNSDLSQTDLSIETISVVEKYAGNELFLKIAKLRQQSQSQKETSAVPSDSAQENNEAKTSFEEYFANLTNESDTKEPPAVEEQIEEIKLPLEIEPVPTAMESKEEIQDLAPMEEEEEEEAPMTMGEDGDDFDLYGDIGGMMTSMVEEEENEEPQSSNTALDSSKANDEDNLYGDLYTNINEAKDKPVVKGSSEVIAEKAPVATPRNDTEARNNTFQFIQNYPSINWADLSYLNQVTSSFFHLLLLFKLISLFIGSFNPANELN
jgi:hypothetical protein